MTPPKPAATVADEDLDDLDDVLDEFNNPSTAATQSKPSSTSRSNVANDHQTAQRDEFPDPDEDALLDAPGLDDQLMQELTKGMQSMFAGLGSAGTGTGAADEGLAGLANLDNEEWRKLMNEFIKEEVNATKNGSASGDKDGTDAGDDRTEEEAMLEMLKVLQMGAQGQQQSSTNATNDKGKAKASAAASSSSAPSNATAATSTSGSNAATGTQSFQDTIAATLSKMKETSSTVDAETEAKTAAGADPLAALMAQMAAGGDGEFGGEEGLQSMLDEMMGQLMSRDVLYEPLKELRDKYPAYLKENESKLPADDLKRFKQQQSIVNEIVAKFEQEGSDADEDAKIERQNEITELVAKMNDCGAPPKEIMGEMPADLELGPDGMPKMPEDCIIS
ncbi:Peroxisome chaperone and import receptor [Microbotryomycetes sp. JL221]|nr:Peroxisome chaperone and import receptor [Microbotryomycetes sp. JL221]